MALRLHIKFGALMKESECVIFAYVFWRNYFFNDVNRGGILRYGMNKDMVSRTRH